MLTLDGCGKACSTSQTTSPTTDTTISSSDSLLDDLNTFYTRFETSSIDTEAHTLRPLNPPPILLLSHQLWYTKSAEENQPLQNSRTRQHPWMGPQSLCYGAG